MKPYHVPQSQDQKPFVVWDIEAVDWFTVRCVVALHSNGEWFVAKTVPDLFREGIRRGWVDGQTPWFAHYGGRYDHLIAVRDLLPEWELVRGIYHAGFGLWSCRWQLGDIVLELCDSMRLLPGSVASIGKTVGLEKLDVDRTHIEDVSWNRLVRYCLRDCEIVRAGLLKLWNVLPQDGTTLASRSTRTLRREVPAGAWGWNSDNDRDATPAYFGGRVEVFRRFQRPDEVFDINSAYPAEMSRKLPTMLEGERRMWNGESGIVYARVRVPPCEYPVLPYTPQAGRHKHAIMFPVGEWSGCWTAPELRRAVECGTKIVKVHRFLRYRMEPWMRAFMVGQYESRRVAKGHIDRLEGLLEKGVSILEKRSLEEEKRGHQFTSYTAKVLLNSCYGKLVERPDHENWTSIPHVVGSDEDYDERHVTLANGKTRVLRVVSTIDDGAFRHAAAAAYVTSRTRVLLHKGIVESDAAYCDTDCVHCAPGRTPPVVSAETLGAFKHEATHPKGRMFLAPKLYAGPLEKGEFEIRAKGFTLPCDDDGKPVVTERELWENIVRGYKVPRETSRSFVGMINHRDMTPKRDTNFRAYKGAAPKRAPDGFNRTRPWTIGEIDAK